VEESWGERQTFSMEELKILILDDEKDYREGIEEYLSNQGFTVFKAAKPSDGLNILKNITCDIVVLDVKLPEMNGIQVLKRIKQLYPLIEVIMITGHGDMDSVIESLRSGASDFFTKPFRLVDLKRAIERTRRFIDLQNRVNDLQDRHNHLVSSILEREGDVIIGNSAAINKIFELMEKVAKTDDTSVLITGDCGTGKELVARGIHALSSRKREPFFDVNCGSIPDNLFESEFFGHNKGAFTGAIRNKPGFLETSGKGTLFLDEVCEMPKHMQTKLLRVLEGKTFRRVGSNHEIAFRARVISATNKNIENAVKNNELREDLLFRLNTFHIHLPTLKERKEDIPLLIDHFMRISIAKFGKTYCRKVDPAVYDALLEYEFTGNVRELEHMIEEALIMCDESVLRIEHFKNLKVTQKKVKFDSLNLNQLVIKEKEMIRQALNQAKKNKTKAAQLLNISRSALNRKLSKYHIE